MSAPLKAFRVLHLTANIPGPLAAHRLTQAGAAVTKGEPPQGGQLADGCPDWYRTIHEGQSIQTLDLKQEDSRRMMGELLGTCDLFLTSLRGPALKRLGLDWESVHATYPRLSMLVIQGYPAPYDHLPA